MSEPALPAPGTYLSSIRESTRKLCETSQLRIDKSALERLLLSDAFKSTYDRCTTLPGIALPLNFASAIDELNLLSILALLSFGSSYDAPVRVQTGHGASNAIRALVFSMYITSTPTDGDLLSAKGLKDIASAKVAELMGLQVHVEKPHPTIPGVVVGELGGPTFDFVQLVTGVLNETGKLLLEQGYPNLGFLVVEALKEADKSGSGCDVVIEKLARAIPAFRDMATIDGTPVYIFSKLIFLLNAISSRFGSITPPPFPIPPVENLPISSDNAATSILLHLGALDLSAASDMKTFQAALSDEAILNRLLASGLGIPLDPRPKYLAVSVEQEYRLRAAAIVACETISEVAKDLSLDISTPRINIWLQCIFKERSDYKTLPGFTAKKSVHF